MQVTVVTAPTLEPISAAEAKAYARATGTAEDELVGTLITTARRAVELDTGRALVGQKVQVLFDSKDIVSPFEIPMPPFIGGALDGSTPTVLTTFKVYDEDDASSDVSGDDYQIVGTGVGTGVGNSFARLIEDGDGWTWGRTYHAAEITYFAGYGDAAVNVPEDIRTAIKYLVNEMLVNRQHAVVGTVAGLLPDYVEYLLAPYRLMTLV